MNKKVASAIKCIVFLAGVVVMIALFDFFFAQSGYIRYIFKYNEQTKDEYTGLVLGASHARSAIDPQKIDDESGDTNTLSLAIPGETLKDSCYVLEEALRSQSNVKRVILDVDYQYWYGEISEGYFQEAFIYNQLSWTSPVKWEYLASNLTNLDIRNALTKRNVYSISLSSIKANVEQKMSESYKNADIYSLEVGDANGPYVGKGFFSRVLSGYKAGGMDYINNMSELYKSGICDFAVKYFNQLKKICDDKGIELICVTSPIAPSVMETLHLDVVHDDFVKFFNEQGIAYFDFNMARFDVLPRTDYDYGDLEGHMGGEPAERYSKVLGEVLNKYTNNNLKMTDYFYETFDQVYANVEE